MASSSSTGLPVPLLRLPRGRRLLAVVVVLLVLGVQRLGRELGAALVEQLDLQRVAAEVVGGDEREASLDEQALVDGQAGELAGDDGAAVAQRPAPDERH